MAVVSFVLTLVTDPSAPGGVIDVTRAALREAPPGRVALQVRDKGASARALYELSAALSPICRAASAPLVVNDRADVAALVGADGVQLPEAGLTVAQARRVLGPRALVGRSCHDRAGLEAAQADGADFATLAPVGAVRGKGSPLGVEGFARAIDGLVIPVHALGAVDGTMIRPLLAAGATGIAVVRAVYAATDPAAAVRSMLVLLS